MVQFEVHGVAVRVNINDTLDVVPAENFTEPMDVDSKPEKNEVIASLPEASFKELENYNICDAPTRPNAYIRFIEKSAEELDGEVCQNENLKKYVRYYY